VAVVIVVAAASGCTFRASASTDASESVPIDASNVAPDDGPVPVDSGLSRAACSAPDATGLVACYEFDDSFADGTLLDSAINHHDATTSGMSPATRGTSHAASVGSQAKTYAPQTTDFDRHDAYTIAMWIHPRSLPFGGAYGLVDHENQYAMALVDDQIDGFVMVRCIHTNVDAEWVAMTSSTSWTFIACTYDGDNLCSRRFTSSGDHDAFCHSGAGQPNATGTHGLAIGHLSNNGNPGNRFDGDIDSVQLYSRALTKAELCAVAAQPASCLDN
jgi:hypothetical protein